MEMDWKKYIAVTALVVSIISFTLTYRLSRQSAVTSVRPVLVFEYSHKDNWGVRNVGNGPALNVIVAKKTDTTDWYNPVRIPPLAKDGQFSLADWLYDDPNVRTLGAYYCDIVQRKYSSTCTNDLSEIHKGNKLKDWPEKEIKKHWHYKTPQEN